MNNRNGFGTQLKQLRLKSGLTMGRVARAVCSSVAQYSAAESSKAKPFSTDDIDYDVLAHLVGPGAYELRDLATVARGVGFEGKSAFECYLYATIELRSLIAQSKGDGAEADALREVMTDWWSQMTPEQLKISKAVSVLLAEH